MDSDQEKFNGILLKIENKLTCISPRQLTSSWPLISNITRSVIPYLSSQPYDYLYKYGRVVHLCTGYNVKYFSWFDQY